jgi:hypothetical protein
VPTLITSTPTATASVSPQVFAVNLAEAKALNDIYGGLTEQSSCTGTQVACIKGSVAQCGTGGAFDLDPCDAGTACFALPMNNTEGSMVGCFDVGTAERILGIKATPPAASTSKASATSSSSSTSKPSAEQPTAVTITLLPTITNVVTVTLGDAPLTLTVSSFRRTTLRRTRSKSPASSSTAAPAQGDGGGNGGASNPPATSNPPARSFSRVIPRPPQSTPPNLIPIIPVDPSSSGDAIPAAVIPTAIVGGEVQTLSVAPTVTVFVTVTQKEKETVTVTATLRA